MEAFQAVVSFLADVDWREALWFTVVTMLISNGLMFGICTILEVVERKGLFEHARIQLKPVVNARPPLWPKVILQLIKLHFGVQPIGLPVFYLIMKQVGVRFSGPAPPWHEALLHLVMFLLLEDASFYWLHRALHTPFLYKHIHKLHHEYKQPNCWATEYTNVIEYTVVNGASAFLGGILLRSHIWTIWAWLAIRTLEGLDGHSGYDFWFSPFRYFPFRPGASVHDYHHSNNVGNYGSFFTFWDSICGTDLAFKAHEEKRKKREISKDG